MMGAAEPSSLTKVGTQFGQWVDRRTQAIWSNLLQNHLWQRMLKNTLATTISVIIALVPAVVRVYGPAAYLAPIVSVFGHPGRRFGMMAEALVLTLSGTLVGVGWSVLGIYLSSLVYASNVPAAYTIKGVFLALSLLLHGFLRSHSPRLFNFVLLLVIVTVVSLVGTATAVSSARATVILYPVLTAVAILLLVNLLVFPEFSSSFLGRTTIDTLEETVSAVRDAGKYFLSIVEDPETVQSAEAGMGDDGSPATTAEGPKEPGKQQVPLSQRLSHVFRKRESLPSKTPLPVVIKAVKLKSLTNAKSKLRAKLAGCKSAQQECNFELAWAVLPPRDLKSISDTKMDHLVANAIALIGACESKYALMGDAEDQKDGETVAEHVNKNQAKAAGAQDEEGLPRLDTGVNSTTDEKSALDEWVQKNRKQKSRSRSRHKLEKELKDLTIIKPHKEIESGDVELLKYLVSRVARPLTELQTVIDQSVYVVTSCLAYCYDVPNLPSGAPSPSGIELEEIDIRVDLLTDAMADFDRNSAAALESAASLQDLEHLQVDVMPRMETFLVSSFLLNFRQAALHTLEMLRHSRILVEKRQARRGRSRLYTPRINWAKWLVSGGEDEPLALPENARKDARTGRGSNDEQDGDEESVTSEEKFLARNDVESAPRNGSESPPQLSSQAATPQAQKGTVVYRFRQSLADTLEYLAASEDVLYAIKIAVAVFLVTWPAFLYKWNAWYASNRGLWAALQLILVTEVAIGTSVMMFMLRAVGTTVGCIWGYAAFQAHNGNRIVCVVILVIGIIPSTYVQLGSKYVKAGMVSIISMCVVALATADHTVPGAATENFLKRMIAFLIGGVVALLVEVLLFPVRARDRLVESLATSVHRISEMQSCIAYGIETETNVDAHSAEVKARFDRAKAKAQGALMAAETFLPFCAQEPRLKGSFKSLALIYDEIIYVLHTVVDRMDNIINIRQEYGSGVLEDLNEKVYRYRRNVAGSITIVLFAVHEALTTKLPLPQFLPSARLAHLRLVNRVREVMLAGEAHRHNPDFPETEMTTMKRVVQQRFMSWNAVSAGQIEVIEYLEELIDLVKLLVGANEFRYGMLTRHVYNGYVDRMHIGPVDGAGEGSEEREARDIMPESAEERPAGLKRRPTAILRAQEDVKQTEGKAEGKAEMVKTAKTANEGELPRSLRRMRSRRIEELNLKRTQS